MRMQSEMERRVWDGIHEGAGTIGDLFNIHDGPWSSAGETVVRCVDEATRYFVDYCVFFAVSQSAIGVRVSMIACMVEETES